MDSNPLLHFPTDFIEERSNIPCLDGVREGKGTIYYKCKNHPEWTIFIFQGVWENDLLNGPFSLIHNNCIILEGEYKNNILYYKKKRCENGLVYTGDYWKSIEMKMQKEIKDCDVKTVFPIRKSEEVGEEVSEEENEEENDDYNDDYDKESEEEIADDFVVQPVKVKESPQAILYKKVIYDHFHSILPCHFIQYESSSHRTFWYFCSPSYFIITTVI